MNTTKKGEREGLRQQQKITNKWTKDTNFWSKNKNPFRIWTQRRVTSIMDMLELTCVNKSKEKHPSTACWRSHVIPKSLSRIRIWRIKQKEKVELNTKREQLDKLARKYDLWRRVRGGWTTEQGNVHSQISASSGPRLHTCIYLLHFKYLSI